MVDVELLMANSTYQGDTVPHTTCIPCSQVTWLFGRGNGRAKRKFYDLARPLPW